MAISIDEHRRQIFKCWSELRLYESLQRQTEERIQDLRELIRATANFLPDNERRIELMLLDMLKHPTNIAESVKVALFIGLVNKERLTPTQIKEKAERRGFSFTEYTNPLASIHTILRRMKDADPPEVDFDEASSSYLLIMRPSILAPEFTEKVKNQTWERVVGTALSEPVNPEKVKALMDHVANQFVEGTFEKTPRTRGE